MPIINAVYQLSEIRRTSGELHSHSRRSPRAESANPAAQTPPPDSASRRPEAPREEILSLPEMLHHHFVDEVHRRDRDADGRLSPIEYGGTREEFNALDRTGKGYVSAQDLTREALARNAELRDIVTGPWTPIYEALIRVEEPDDPSLIGAVREGAARVAEQMARRDDPASSAQSRHSRDDQIAGIMADFIMNHRELSELHNRLQTLADRLGRYRRYAPVDLFG